ncbi:Threonine aldolase [Chytridiales sp. JEL 0842]|nr:Threonine aldolase [Chytridiales sp. JEL 0842]
MMRKVVLEELMGLQANADPLMSFSRTPAAHILKSINLITARFKSMYSNANTSVPVPGDPGRSQTIYDFRITKPTKGMKEYMLRAEVGDDVFDEDPTVNKLQELATHLTGHEAALFCPSATMCNQLAVRSHLTSGPHSVICDSRAHVFKYEASGIAYHCGAMLIPVKPKEGERFLTAEVIEKELILDDDIHHAPTKLVCLENTINGEIFPLEDIEKISALVRKNNVKIHLDGSRLWNASIATGISIKEYASSFDSVSLCLSKGLGSPIGSLLTGSKETIKKAKHFRKMWGGGWRQAGLLAAAAIYAIEHHWPAMKTDHANAKILANTLTSLGFPLTRPVETNMVWVDTTPLNVSLDELQKELEKEGIMIFGGGVGESRWVLHHQVPLEGVEKLGVVLRGVLVRMGRLRE